MFLIWALLVVLLILAACVRNQPDVIVITATFQPAPVTTLQPTPSALAGQPTAVAEAGAARRYVVQPGDTLSLIAANEGVSVALLIQANNLTDPNLLEVGQELLIPAGPSLIGSDFGILPDNRLVRAPGSAAFDIRAFISQQPGYVRIATDSVDQRVLTAADVVERVAFEYSVDPRLLLTLLEYRGRWLTNPTPGDTQRVYPLGAPASPLGFDRNGLYRQLAWAADQLNYGYYSRKYRRLTSVEFPDEGIALRFADGLPYGTIGLQYMLSLYNTYGGWQRDISPSGVYATYLALFGDPFDGAVETLTPTGLTQPALVLPFPAGVEWFYTGGPHGGWGSGSAWAAVDFAPPDDLETVSSACYVSQNFATAVAPGVIARTSEGVVVLDLDGDGDEATGWSILYLHVAAADRVLGGMVVNPGDNIGRPSCEGGFSNGTHLHLARRYNGEWIPADCSDCPPNTATPNFVMSDWTFYGYTNQEYQGYTVNSREQRVAEQGRNDPNNRVMW
ncbi:MAG: LysM peptidoglycan-binding domain-containing protein [Anaerolineae bacterium]|nr:LysM peptidoglycan-binding domain-containing protein [Anaerolineae bacterium]